MSLMSLLAGPWGNPFKIHTDSRDRTKTLGRMGNSRLTWEKKTLPGAGAGQYAWETYGLPPYARFGFGNINVQRPSNATAPASYHLQAVGIVGNPPKSIVQGQFTTQPLMDPTQATLQGIVLPGAVSSAPNAIANAAPILSG